MADWSLLGNFLEEVQEHSTSVGKVSHKRTQTLQAGFFFDRVSVTIANKLLCDHLLVSSHLVFVSAGVADHPVHLPYLGTGDGCRVVVGRRAGRFQL